MKKSNPYLQLMLIIGCLLLWSCGASNPPQQSSGHLNAAIRTNDSIPEPVTQVPVLPAPKKQKKLETYTVVVNQVPVRELLFSMARDASINLDIDNNIKGRITMNAVQQTLPKILDRIAAQSNILYTLEGDTLHVRADVPVLRHYDVHYLNIERSSKGSVSVSTEIGTSGGVNQGGGSSAGQGGSGGSNKASTSVDNKADNRFWATLTDNIASILEKNNSENKVDISNSIIVNKESGTIAVRATEKQHRLISRFIDKVVGNAQRQVLIEATIAEVRLSDKYQAGIDWSVIGETATDVNGNTVLVKGGVQSVLGGNLASTPLFQLAGTGSVNGDPLNITLRALETFGDVKVLSSPKVMSLNNQTAILKVVDNEVFFTTNVEIDAGTVNQNSTTVIDTEVNTIPIGFIMSVTPFIDEDDVVTLSVRPTITRIIRFVNDPNPELVKVGVVSQIPVVQVREIETMLTINNNDTAVLGGLMQDQIDKTNRGVPGLSSIPWLGQLFSYQEEELIKTELVIFIRPVVIHEASLEGDLSDYRKYLDLDVYGESQPEKQVVPVDADE